MTQPVRLASALAFGVLMWSCSGHSGSSGPASSTPVSPSRRILLVTHTEGFGHSSIEITETTVAALGHRQDVWQNTSYQEHILGGIRWVLPM